MARFTPPLCDRCGDPLASWRDLHAGTAQAGICRPCVERRSAVASSRSIGPYDGSLRAILHAFKYDGCRSLSHRLGDCLRECAGDILVGCRRDRPGAASPTPTARPRLQPGGRTRGQRSAFRCSTCSKRTRLRLRRPDFRRQPATRQHEGAFALAAELDVAGFASYSSTTSARPARRSRRAHECCARGAPEVSAVTAARVVSQPPE